MKSLADIAGLSQSPKKIAINYSFDVNPDAKAIQSAILSGEEPQGLFKATPVIVQEDKPISNIKEASVPSNLTNANPATVQGLEEVFDKSTKSDKDVNDYFDKYMDKAMVGSIDDKSVSDIKKNIADYINSPLYAKRQRNYPEEYLAKFDSTNPLADKEEYQMDKSLFQSTIKDEKRKNRLAQLESVPVEFGDKLEDNYYSSKQDLLKLSKTNIPSIVSHELGHSITMETYAKDKEGKYIKDSKGEYIKKASESSDAHNNRYYESPITTNKGERAGIGLNSKEVDKFIKLAKDATNPEVLDEHNNKKVSGFAYEQYGDLYGVRKLLYDNGVTKSFGENIDKKKMEGILNNKNITTDPVFKRFFSRYGADNIIELNNTIAMNNQSMDNQNFMV
jgi:hypothetical protein